MKLMMSTLPKALSLVRGPREKPRTQPVCPELPRALLPLEPCSCGEGPGGGVVRWLSDGFGVLGQQGGG